MNVLVVGGAGYIGSVTSAALMKSGHRVVVLDNLSKGHREAVPREAGFVEGDLADAGLVAEICRTEALDAALHFAAFTEVGESVAEPAKYFDNNSFKTKALIDALRASGVNRFIFSSTAAVYGEPQILPIPEDHPKSPTNPYGWSKLFVEEILDSYRVAYDFRAIRLRYFNAAGATPDHGEDHTPESHLVPVVLEVAEGKRSAIKLFGTDWNTPDGTCVRDFIHVSDLADAHIRALEALSSGHPGGAYNLGNGEGCSVLEVVETARGVTGHPIPVETASRRPGDPARLVASSESARKELGWTPRYPGIREIVESAWQWRQAHPQGYRSQ